MNAHANKAGTAATAIRVKLANSYFQDAIQHKSRLGKTLGNKLAENKGSFVRLNQGEAKKVFADAQRRGYGRRGPRPACRQDARNVARTLSQVFGFALQEEQVTKKSEVN